MLNLTLKTHVSTHPQVQKKIAAKLKLEDKLGPRPNPDPAQYTEPIISRPEVNPETTIESGTKPDHFSGISESLSVEPKSGVKVILLFYQLQ